MQFPYIENYVEFLAGTLTAKGAQVFQWNASPPFPLASYDVKFVTSVADQILNNIGLTDRQATLVERLIKTYQRRLSQFGLEQPSHTSYKLPIRVVNRTTGLFIKGDKLHYKFPFNSFTIAKIKEFSKTSQGAVKWDRDNSAWTFALTEYNLSWVYTLATGGGQISDVTIDPEVKELFDMIIAAEQEPYAIELTVNEQQQAVITNGPASLTEYIDQHVGMDDIYQLVDYSGALGYTVDAGIVDTMTQLHGSLFMSMCLSHAIDCTPANTSIDDVLQWATIVKRFPIVVYNPNFAKHDSELFAKYFTADETQIIKDLGTGPAEIDPTAKLIYTNKVLTNFNGPIPLLISYANLMHGASKKEFLQTASKVVYYCEKLPKR